MRSATLVLFIFLSSLPAIPQDKEDSLSKDLQALHAKWFKAFDNGDGEAMDNLETNNLVLVMPDGTIWPKDTPRAGKQRKLDPDIERTLSQVSVRRFGSAAILTSILATRLPKQKDISKEATTVVFIESSGTWSSGFGAMDNNREIGSASNGSDPTVGPKRELAAAVVFRA